MIKRKRPSFLQETKQVFNVSIHPDYWPFVFPDWNESSEEKRGEIIKKVYNDFDKHLTSGKKKLTIFSPLINGRRSVEIDMISGKKRSRIIYKTS